MSVFALSIFGAWVVTDVWMAVLAAFAPADPVPLRVSFEEVWGD